jgi:hypothetical protein
MRPSGIKKTGFVLVTMIVCAFGLPATSAIEPMQTLPLAAADALPFIKHRQRNNLNHIYQFDATPLGQRTPLILLPGRAEEYQQNAWWHTLHKQFKRRPHLVARYKPYAYIYNSDHRLPMQVQGFVSSYQQAQFPRPSVWVSYSLGGVIAREAMLHPDILPQVQANLAIAVPFHGSPIFNPEWFAQYLQPPNHSPVRRLSDRALYRFYLLDKTNLIEGMRWNNMDGSFPLFKPNTVVVKPVFVYEPFWNNLQRLTQLKQRTIVYASFLDNPYTGRALSSLSRIQHAEKLTKDLLTSILPLDFVSVHAVMRYTNLQMSNLPTQTTEGQKNQHVFRYNDGVVPISSALFLPERPTLPYTEQMTELAQLADVRQVRLFKGWDHMEIGEYFARTSRRTLHDVTEPTQKAQSPNAWVFTDLVNLHDARVEPTPTLP